MGDERDPLTDSELEQMERRCDAASKPPWQSFIEGRDACGGDNFIRISDEDDEDDMYVSRHGVVVGLVPASDADLDFIASARQDIPRLIAEVRRLRKS